MGYKFKQAMIRIKYNTLVRLQKTFPAMRNESMKSYFERIAKYMEELK